MKDTDKTKAQLIQELTELRQSMAELEAEKDARQHAEEALRESEQKLRGLIENSTDAIRLFNEDGVVEVWNPTSEAIYNIAPEQAIGRFVWEIEAELGFPDYREDGLETLRTGLMPEEWNLNEFTIAQPDGSTRHIQAKAFMIPIEQGFWGASIHRDITERVMMEVKYRELVENLHDAIYIVDNKGVLTYVSPAIEPFLGYSPTELIGKPFTQFVYPEDLPLIQKSYQTIAEGRPYSGPNDYRAVAKSGEICWMRLSSRPVFQDDCVIGVQGILTDITEQKQAEDSLRESEEKLRTLTETVPDLIMMIDRPGTILFVNRTVTGVSLDKVIGRNFFDFMLNENRPIVRSHIEQVFLNGETTSYEMQDPRGTDVPRWFITRAAPVNSGDEVIAATIIATDITERKEAEARLRESEARYRALAEATLEGIGITEEGVIIDVNNRFGEMLGYARDEMIGKRTSDFIFPEDQEFVQHETTSDHGHTYEYRLTRKDNSIIEIEAHGKSIVYRGHPARITIIRDITARKQVEQVLRESEAKFRTLVDASPVATSIMRDDRFLYVNPAWEEATGYPKDEALAMSPGALFHPDICDEVFQRSAARLKGEDVASRYEAQIVTKDGVLRWFGFTTTIIAYEHIPAILTVSADITERKQAQKHHLALALEKERVQILSNFITQASHEFRTPLSIINTSAYLLKRRKDPVNQELHIHKIEEQVTHIAQLISDLSMMSDLDSIQHLEVVDIDLNEVVQTIDNVRQPTLQAKGLRTVLELSDTPLLVPANSEHLRQAIERIWDNAIQHMPDGGTITVRSQRLATNTVLEINDTGSGIREADLPRIFERFYRADEAGTTRGFGLGLSIAKAIVALHQGSIEVESVEGKGSTFRILLPLA